MEPERELGVGVWVWGKGEEACVAREREREEEDCGVKGRDTLGSKSVLFLVSRAAASCLLLRLFLV